MANEARVSKVWVETAYTPANGALRVTKVWVEVLKTAGVFVPPPTNRQSVVFLIGD